MLQVKDVRKKYVTGELVQTALDGVSLNLRESELVAILGPSGSGKSTLLNVIGGLDQYDSGDLIINGISTKEYTDRDWDSYRNHTIGFVFQSYNLIPHQTVLANVELALTISGVPKSQRRRRAVEALEKVGLGNQLHKKPSQMSGGQMQRVAVARALVNNPSILLADEPTGALDSETSVQIMELLKEVSKDRLVVMVTHNPELADLYADRIVRVRDGRIIGDSNPYEVDEQALQPARHENMGKSSMNFLSALLLSFNNLKSKKGRTLMTAFAGSIGIIGIALILALSVGFQKYIDDVQENTLAGNPLTLQAETADMMSVMMPHQLIGEDTPAADGKVTEQPALSNMFQHFGANDLAAFKKYLEEHDAEIGPSLSSVQYRYNIRPQIYIGSGNNVTQVNPSHLFKNLTGNDLISAVLDVDAFQQMPDDQALLNSQYEILDGRWPEEPRELVFVLPAAGKLSDHIAYTLGMKKLDSLEKMVRLLMDGGTVVDDSEPMEWTYEELLNMTFRLISAPDCYRYNEDYQVWEDLSQDPAHMAEIAESGETLSVVGIVCPKEDSAATVLSPGIGYLPSLTAHIAEKAAESQIVKQQLANPQINVFTGKAFDDSSSHEKLDFKDMITIDGQAMADAFGLNISDSAILNLMEQYLKKMADSTQVDTSAAQQSFVSALTDFIRQMMSQYVADHADGDGNALLSPADVPAMADSFFRTESAQNRIAQLADAYDMTAEAFTDIFRPVTVGLITEYIARQAAVTKPVSPAVLEAEAPPTAVSETSEAPTVYAESSTESTEIPAETVLPTVSPETSEPVESTPVTPENLVITIGQESADELADSVAKNPIVVAAAPILGKKMMESTIVEQLMKQAAGFSDVLADYFSDAFYVDGDKLVDSVHFRMSEDEIKRLISALSPEKRQKSAESNLQLLGYADLNAPDSISFYMNTFEAKEKLVQFIADYNSDMENSQQESKVIRYTDMTAMMMDSVRMIIRTVSYSLIAFVAVSLIVSSIMIGIITYISVMERTKEIGILRAMGASKHNISQVFNAETFIIGLFSGLIGIGFSLILLIPGNRLMHSLLGTDAVNAYLPLVSALILVGISMLLTLLGGLIPSRQAAKKDPVIALRSE